jgi:hypothetical protein
MVGVMAGIFGEIVRSAALALGIIVVATFVSDGVHWALHRMAKSRSPLLRRMGAMHDAHHDFWDRRLAFHDEARRANLLRHRLPEFLVLVSTSALLGLFLGRGALGLALLFFVCSFSVTTWNGGHDSNHQPIERLRAPGSAVFVGIHYHALHHVFPSSYFASFTTLFDRVFGTGCHLEDRRIVITGASGAFGAPLAKMLREAGAAEVTALKFGRDYDYGDYDRLDDALAGADILVLSHGSKVDRAMEANCDSYVALIERYRRLRRESFLPCEVWATGSEIECHPSWGDAELEIYSASKRAFARRARWYFHRPDMVYRHIVASAFTSRMGPGLISGEAAAALAMFFIRRGFRYIPVTYTGIAWVNYLKFALALHARAPEPAASGR